MSADWKSILSQVAPTIATALGGPLAGMAVAFIGNKVLGKPAATVDDIANLVTSTDPQALVQLKQAELDFQAHLQDVGVQLDQLDVSDRESARNLAIARGFWPQIALSVVFLGGYFMLMWVIVVGSVNIPPAYHDLAVTLIGVLTAGVPMILNFWFGSTHGSQKKDNTIAAAALED